MTVCIAAIAGKPIRTALSPEPEPLTIFAASDRMLTSFAQYQSPEPKIRKLTTAIIAMWSGDAAFQAGILNDLDTDVGGRVAANEDEWLDVQFVAYLYQEHFNRARKRMMEQSVLSPFQLDTQSFLSTHTSMLPRLAERLFSEMGSFKPPTVQTLIVGWDRSGAHIYEFENIQSAGDVICHDAEGFAAIGSGGYQAASQFMLAGHGPSRPRSDTLFLTYLAKKRAQSAPGVGEDTDILVCEPRIGRLDLPGWWRPLNEAIWNPLEEAYQRLERAENKAMERAKRNLEQALGPIIAPPPPPGQTTIVAASNTIPVAWEGPTTRTTKAPDGTSGETPSP